MIVFSFDEMVVRKLSRKSGFPVTVGQVKSRPLMGRLQASDFEISNPVGFPVTDFLSLTDVKVHFSPSSLFGKRVRVKEMEIHLRQLTGVRAESGVINIQQFREAMEREDEEPPGPRHDSHREIECGRLALRIDHVAMLDYTVGQRGRRDYPVLFDREFRAVTDWRSVAPALVTHFAAAGLSRAADAIFATLLPAWLWVQVQAVMERERENG